MSKILDRVKKAEKYAKLPFMVLVVSLALTIGITFGFYRSAKSKDLLRFNNEVLHVQSVIENKVNLYLALLKGGRGFVESAKEVNRENFANYVKSLELDKNYIGVQGIGYNKIVLPDEREALLKQMKAEGYVDFKIFPEGERDLYQAIIYIEPFNERNQKAIGFDMSTEANRREALERARDSGQAAATAKIILIQENENDKQAGFLIYLPIYKDGELPTVEARKTNLKGYIYSPFRAGDFLNEVQKSASAADLSISIYDGETEAENLLAQTGTKTENSFTNQINEQYSKQEELNVSGRKWLISYHTLPAFAEQSSLGWTPLILLSGLVASFLLFGMTYWEASVRVKLQNITADLFELEKQKQVLLENEHKARVSAEQANKTKDEFIAVVSHELRTPLNAIAGWTQILRTDSVVDKTKNLALDKIEKNLRSQTELVEELLDFSKIISGNVHIEDEKVDFSKVFEETFQAVEASARERGIELVKENQLNNQYILGNPEKIRLVIHNLLANAVKFTQDGGKVESFISNNNGNIEMIVKDNGRGISLDYLPHIFDRFHQADNSITRTHGGLGLGLAITYHIVQLHKGTIEASSEGIGKGSTFTLKIPTV